MKRLLLIPVFAVITCLLLSVAPTWAQETGEVAELAEVTEIAEDMAEAIPMDEIGGAVAAGLGAAAIVITVVSILFGLLGIIVTWKIYSKAGKPGVACLIPIWSNIVFCQAAGKPGWWFILHILLFPIFHILLCIGLAQQFGKGAGFGLGLVFLPIIFFPILAFGGAEHESLMQLPGDEEGAGVIGAPGRPPRKPRVITDSTRYAVAAWLGIVTLLILLTIIAFQVYEMHYYSSELPEHGTGSAWRTPIVPDEGAPAPTPEPEPTPEPPAPGTNAPVAEAETTN